MKYIVIRDMSAGNESVGEQWQETKIFDETSTLKDVMQWAMGPDSRAAYSRKRITITKPDNEEDIGC